MNKKTKGLLAGAAGAALLLGGGTFALWSDSETIDGGTITAGNLDIELVGDPVWVDTSSDRTDASHPIDLADFRIIPGDQIQGLYYFEAALQGENMVGALGLSSASAGADSEFLEHLDVTVEVYDVEGSRDTPPILEFDWHGDPVEVLFASDDNGNPEGLPTLPVATDGTADFSVQIIVDFPDDGILGTEYVQDVAELGQLQIGLDQVREDAPGYN